MPEVEQKHRSRLLVVFVAGLAIVQGGCLLILAGVAGGATAGYFFYKGRISQDYPAHLLDVHHAVHAALLDLHFLVLNDEVKDGKAFLLTKTTNGKKVRIYVNSLNSPIPAEGLITRVSIRVACFGDEAISKRILNQIGLHLVPGPAVIPAPPPSPTPVQQTSATRVETTPPPLAVPKPIKSK